ncbi:High-affinity branched-chain amino acid transport ATP-binding protein LivF [subsurface metagenome]
MLKINKIDTYYGGLHILKGLSMEVRDGELVALIGANGAGKTTLLMAISGIIVPTAGDIEYDGVRINGLASQDIVKLGITQIPEGRLIFDALTVDENLKLGHYLRRDKDGIAHAYEDVYTLFPILKERGKQIARTLSGGEQQMLAIARGLMANPKLILMDEPSLGLAPVLVESVAEIISQIKSRGLTILLVEQNANMALRLADRGYVLQVGEIVMEDASDKLLNSEEVKKAYLGI